jgi:hypothetical protein
VLMIGVEGIIMTRLVLRKTHVVDGNRLKYEGLKLFH